MRTRKLEHRGCLAVKSTVVVDEGVTK